VFLVGLLRDLQNRCGLITAGEFWLKLGENEKLISDTVRCGWNWTFSIMYKR
jgi:hypothetical protein